MNSSPCVTYLSHHDLAVYLNNAGCSAIEAGGGDERNHLDAAAGTLRDALDALSRPPSAVRGGDRATHDIDEYLSYRAELLRRTHERRLSEETPSSSKSGTAAASSSSARRRRAEQSQHVDELVFSEPLRLEPLELEDSSSLQRDDDEEGPSLEEISAVVLFNVSLTYHLIGERYGSAAHVDRAATFYEMTESMVLEAIGGCNSSNSSLSSDRADRLSVIVKAVLNNMGQICLHWRGEPGLGRAYFSRLASLAAPPPAPAGIGRESTWSTRSRAPLVDTFTFNAMVTSGMNAAGAA